MTACVGLSALALGGDDDATMGDAARTNSLADDLFGDDVHVEEGRQNTLNSPPPQMQQQELPTEEPDPYDDSTSDASPDADAEKQALEYLEDEESAPMVQEQTAWLNLVQQPVRRTKPMHVARLPNFVRYSERAFDAATWHEDAEEDEVDVGDNSVRSVLRTTNTIRWRWRDAPSGKTPESNARVVRWSDGTSSLQLGTEFFDMATHSEPNLAGAHGAQIPLTYVYVPHPKEGVLEAEAAVRTVHTFKPNLHSETHSRMASALRHQRGARVVATSELFGALDPEREKERIERQLKETERRKHRERLKNLRNSANYEGDLDLNVRRGGARPRRTRSSVTEWSDDEDDDRGPAPRSYLDYEDDDGFVVQDEEDEEDAEASEDDMDRADREIEEHERRRHQPNDS